MGVQLRKFLGLMTALRYHQIKMFYSLFWLNILKCLPFLFLESYNGGVYLCSNIHFGKIVHWKNVLTDPVWFQMHCSKKIKEDLLVRYRFDIIRAGRPWRNAQWPPLKIFKVLSNSAFFDTTTFQKHLLSFIMAIFFSNSLLRGLNNGSSLKVIKNLPTHINVHTGAKV